MSFPTAAQGLSKAFNDFSPQKMAVIGDAILDRYTWGSVTRISPEAPIPIVNVENIEYRSGGAACAAANLAALGCETTLFGVVGQDENADKLRNRLKEIGVSYDGLVVDPNFTTIMKDRILGNHQQLLRIDHELVSYSPSQNTEQAVLKEFRKQLSNFSGVLISDYNKGFLTENILREIIEECSVLGIPTVVDPGSGRSPSIYRGSTAIKPNRLEASKIIGKTIHTIKEATEAGLLFSEQSESRYVLLSLDREGVLLVGTDGTQTHFPTRVREVSDVTGAGDTLCATFSALISSGYDASVALGIANVAAGLSVSFPGVVHLRKSKILHELKLIEGEVAENN